MNILLPFYRVNKDGFFVITDWKMRNNYRVDTEWKWHWHFVAPKGRVSMNSLSGGGERKRLNSLNLKRKEFC